jgi:hypothetical protein
MTTAPLSFWPTARVSTGCHASELSARKIVRGRLAETIAIVRNRRREGARPGRKLRSEQAEALQVGSQDVARDAEKFRGMDLIASAKFECAPHDERFDTDHELMGPVAEQLIQARRECVHRLGLLHAIRREGERRLGVLQGTSRSSCLWIASAATSTAP